MIKINSLTETGAKSSFIKEFIDFPKRLYKNEDNWVPWFDIDMKQILKKKHPFFLHSKGEFFLAEKDGMTVGRICVVSNIRYQEQHNRNCTHFFFLDAVEDTEVFKTLLKAAGDWGKGQGQEVLDGPLLFGGTCGSGILIEGYDQPAPMTMMPYNFPYYREILENLGFNKYFDTKGADISKIKLEIPDRIESLAEKVIERGRFKVVRFQNKRDIAKEVDKIASLYNKILGDHPEDYPLLYHELAKTVRSRDFIEAEVVQIAESTEMMLKDIKNLGIRINKIHRIYTIKANLLT